MGACGVPFLPTYSVNLSTPVPGYRKKSPSQATRDFERYRQWKRSPPQDNTIYEKQRIDHSNIGNHCDSDNDMTDLKSDRSCFTGGRSTDIEQGQHDVCDPDMDASTNRDSLMQEDQNNPLCPADESDHPISNERQYLDKVMYDEEHNCLIARTSDGQYIPYKCDHISENPQSENLYQMLFGIIHMNNPLMTFLKPATMLCMIQNI